MDMVLQLFKIKVKKIMPCRRSYQKKYTNRNSPPYPANECQKWYLDGNDGYEYYSKPDRNGVHRWVRVEFKAKSKKSKSKRRVKPRSKKSKNRK
jgi:hypothetical protein